MQISNQKGILKVIQTAETLTFTNLGVLKLPKETIYKGGVSKTRNPKMQTMLQLIGFGDTAGSRFPTILSIWEDKGWPAPMLEEDMILNQVTLTLLMNYEDDLSHSSTESDLALEPLIMLLIFNSKIKS